MSKFLAIGSLTLFLALQVVLVCAVPGKAVAQGNLQPPEYDTIYLLQPLDDGDNELSGDGIEIFFEYFNRAWPWLVGTAGGVAVLQAVIGGVQIMTSSGGSGKSEGVERMQWAIAGLVMLVLAGLILRTINPLFYQ